MLRAGLGLRVKTAKAIAVALAGDTRDPELVLRQELSLWDPEVAESRQPFHAALGLSPEAARPVVQRGSEAVRRASQRALVDLLEQLAARDAEVVGAALVRASDTDPATIKNPHMYAHAAEGQLFHDALAEAAAAARLSSHSLLEKQAVRDVAHELGSKVPLVERSILNLGRRVGPPWRAEQKTACAGALLALSRARRGARC